MKSRVVLFDDDINNLKVNLQYFNEEYNCQKYMNPFEYEKGLAFDPDIFILNVMMPLLDGPALYKKIINNQNYNGCPIVFISSSNSDELLLEALKSGGQDFLSRNMSKDEIIYRVNNHIQYYKNNRCIFTLGEVRINMNLLKAFENNICIDLTLTELKILRTLLSRCPRPITREEINEELWPGMVVQSNTLNTHISNIRGKFLNWSYEIQHLKNQGILIVPKHNSLPDSLTQT